MQKHLKTGMTLAIISGALGLLWGILIFANLDYAYFRTIVLTVGIVEVVLGLVSVLCGLLAARFQSWGLALAGAIVGIFTFFPTAVAAIIVLGLGKKAGRQPAPVSA